jgi:predicted aconitase with swiveling domain
VILAGIPCVDKIDIDQIKDGDTVVLNADNATVEIAK